MLVNDAQFARHASQDHVRPLSIGRAPVRLVLGAWDGPQQTVQSALARASFFFFFFIGQTGLDQILGFRTLPKAAEGREKSAPGADSHTRPASQWTPGVETNPGDGSISVRPASRDSRHGNRSLTSPSEFSFALRRESRLQAGWRALHGSAVFSFPRPPGPPTLARALAAGSQMLASRAPRASWPRLPSSMRRARTDSPSCWRALVQNSERTSRFGCAGAAHGPSTERRGCSSRTNGRSRRRSGTIPKTLSPSTRSTRRR